MTSFSTPASSARSLFCALAFGVCALFLYSYASHQIDAQIQPLAERCTVFEQRLVSLKHQVAHAAQHVACLSDPAADEYALITQMGKVPEGCTKIILTKKIP